MVCGGARRWDGVALMVHKSMAHLGPQVTQTSLIGSMHNSVLATTAFSMNFMECTSRIHNYRNIIRAYLDECEGC